MCVTLKQHLLYQVKLKGPLRKWAGSFTNRRPIYQKIKYCMYNTILRQKGPRDFFSIFDILEVTNKF